MVDYCISGGMSINWGCQMIEFGVVPQSYALLDFVPAAQTSLRHHGSSAPAKVGLPHPAPPDLTIPGGLLPLLRYELFADVGSALAMLTILFMANRTARLKGLAQFRTLAITGSLDSLSLAHPMES
jgi:hypothetical protein